MKAGDRYISTDGKNRVVTITLVGNSRVAFDGDAVGVCVMDEFNKRYRRLEQPAPLSQLEQFNNLLRRYGTECEFGSESGQTEAWQEIQDFIVPILERNPS